MTLSNAIIRFILAFLFALASAPWAGAVAAAEAVVAPEVPEPAVVDVRTGEHDDYHRVVVELSGSAPYSVVRAPDGVVLLINAALGEKTYEEMLSRMPSTALVAVEGVSDVGTPEAPATRIAVAIKAPSRFKQAVWKDPFRIVMDLFPKVPAMDNASAGGAKAAVRSEGEQGAAAPDEALKPGKADEGEGARTASSVQAQALPASPPTRQEDLGSSAKSAPSAPPEEAPSAGAAGHGAVGTLEAKQSAPATKAPEAATAGEAREAATGKGRAALPGLDSIRATERTVPLGDGWRWALRRELADRLRQGVREADTLDETVLKDALGISATSTLGLMVKARATADAIAGEGRAGDAELLRAIVRLVRTGEGAVELEALLRENPSSGFRPLGWFYLGRHLDGKGLGAEARGYYARVAASGAGEVLKEAAGFSRGRSLYFEGKYAEAKGPLQSAWRAGLPGAGLWLANTLVMKGELARAGRLFKSEVKRSVSELDPESALNIAGLALAGRDYEGARSVYSALASRYESDAGVSAYLAVRLADTYLLEGEYDRAVKLYEEAGKHYEGLGHAAASMALADALVGEGSPESLMRAEGVYREILASEGLLAVFAHKEAVRTEADLRLHASAMENLREFMVRYAADPLVHDLDKFKEELLGDWIDFMYERDDYFGIVKAVSRYGVEVPLGRRAEASFRAGRAFAELSLLPDAVKHLSAAMETGKGGLVEDSMLALAGVYIEQGDAAAAKKMLRSYSNRFPRSIRTGEVARLRARAAFLEGDYSGYAKRAEPGGDGGGMERKAYALYKAGRFTEAAAAYLDAVELYGAADHANGLIRSYIGAADAKSALGRHREAIGLYAKATEEMDFRGDGQTDERSWAAYRTAEAYAALDDAEAVEAALAGIKDSDDLFGRSAPPVLEEPPAF